MDIEIFGVKFMELNAFGDFNYMIKKEINDNKHDSLFIYNDNEECHCSKSYVRGAGNAIIRPYNQFNPKYIGIPHSVGIPTGTLKNGGYDSLNNDNKKYIDESFNEIKNLIEKYKFKHLFYSIDDLSGKLGTSIFKVDINVINYITNNLHKLSNKNTQLVCLLNKNKCDYNYQYEIENDNDNENDNNNDNSEDDDDIDDNENSEHNDNNNNYDH